MQQSTNGPKRSGRAQGEIRSLGRLVPGSFGLLTLLLSTVIQLPLHMCPKTRQKRAIIKILGSWSGSTGQLLKALEVACGLICPPKPGKVEGSGAVCWLQLFSPSALHIGPIHCRNTPSARQQCIQSLLLSACISRKQITKFDQVEQV